MPTNVMDVMSYCICCKEVTSQQIYYDPADLGITICCNVCSSGDILKKAEDIYDDSLFSERELNVLELGKD